jgi:serine/threonine-protein kinase
MMQTEPGFNTIGKPLKIDVATLRRLSPLLDEVLDQEEAQRETWLNALEGDAAELVPLIRHLLAQQSNRATGNLLDRRPDFAASGDGIMPDDAVSFAAGDAIGPYRLLRKLGYGGMGEVWLAEQADGVLKRNVAMKLPVLGARRGILVQRFERERDILAKLAHPNIARLYDAGLAVDGQPYLTLEYVEGEPITVHANRHKLDTQARVRLLRQVMDAVQYAHANLVIHRDLKPGNVLVTGDGKAMLLDFGIAKLLEEETGHTDETELTRLGGRALTLSYAAPEQISGSPISIAVDVWALGVLLYELVTGSRPFAAGERSAIERDVLSNDPLRPSQRGSGAIASLARGLAGDLDTIVLKALKKAPAERYATVNDFANDLDRWLHGEPVMAQPDSAWYRARKFAGRHKVSVTTAALAAAAVIAIAIVAVVLGFQAREESARAIASRDFLIDMFRRTDPDLLQGKDITPRQLLKQGKKNLLDTMSDQPLLQAELLQGMGDAFSSMEAWADADDAYVQAVQHYERTGRLREAAYVLLDQAEMKLINVGDIQRAQGLLEQAAILYASHAGDDEFMAGYTIFQSFAAYYRGDDRAGKEWYERALPYAGKALHDNSVRTVLAIRIIAEIEGQTGKYQQGIDRLNQLMARLKTDKAIQPAQLVGVLDDLGFVERAAGRYRAALGQYEAASDLCKRSFNPKGNQCTYTQHHRSRILLLLGYNERALDTIPVLLPDPAAPDNSTTLTSYYVIEAYNVLAKNRMLDKYPALVAKVHAIGESEAERKKLEMGKFHAMQALLVQADAFLFAHNPEKARELLHRAEALVSGAQVRNLTSESSSIHFLQGQVAMARGQNDVAVELLGNTRAELTKTLGADHPYTQLVSTYLARALWADRHRDEALALLQHAIPLLREAMGEDAPVFLRIAALRDEWASRAR